MVLLSHSISEHAGVLWDGVGNAKPFVPKSVAEDPHPTVPYIDGNLRRGPPERPAASMLGVLMGGRRSQPMLPHASKRLAKLDTMNKSEKQFTSTFVQIHSFSSMA